MRNDAGRKRVDQRMTSRGDRRAAHHAVGAVDRSSLAVDREGPAGVIDVGQHDDPGAFEDGFELDAVGLVVDDAHRFAGRGVAAGEVCGEPGADRVFEPDVAAGVVGDAGRIGPGHIVGEEDLLHRQVAAGTAEPAEGGHRPGVVDDPGAGVLVEVTAHLVVVRS